MKISAQRFRAFAPAMTVAALVSLAGCGDRVQLYELEGVRIPVAQFFLEQTAAAAAADASAAAGKKQVGCAKWADGKTYCQQYPVYTGIDARKFKLRFVAVSPEGQATDFSVSRLTRFALAPGAAAVRAGDAAEVLTDAQFKKWGFKKDAFNSKVVGTKALRVEEIVYDFTVPGLGELLKERNPSPILALDYTATPKDGARIEEGFVTFFVYPDPADDAAWTTLGNLGAQAGFKAEDLATLRKTAKRNTPPVATGITPKAGESSGKKLDIEFSLAGSDFDEGAKSRVQWFTTRGKLGNQRARKTSWDTEGEGPAGAFVVVRDLQGGQDYKFTHVEIE